MARFVWKVGEAGRVTRLGHGLHRLVPVALHRSGFDSPAVFVAFVPLAAYGNTV